MCHNPPSLPSLRASISLEFGGGVIKFSYSTVQYQPSPHIWRLSSPPNPLVTAAQEGPNAGRKRKCRWAVVARAEANAYLPPTHSTVLQGYKHRYIGTVPLALFSCSTHGFALLPARAPGLGPPPGTAAGYRGPTETRCRKAPSSSTTSVGLASSRHGALVLRHI